MLGGFRALSSFIMIGALNSYFFFLIAHLVVFWPICSIIFFIVTYILIADKSKRVNPFHLLLAIGFIFVEITYSSLIIFALELLTAILDDPRQFSHKID